jgi:WhiB family redox-sensing transcriptional regulator
VSLRTVGETWQLHAACRGPESELFYPPAYAETRMDRDSREAQAKAICNGCPVQAPCLELALRIREPHGIWGGLNESERRTVLEREAG